VYEIKSVRGVVEGRIQLAWYLLLLNSFDPLRRTWIPGGSYTPPHVVRIDNWTFALVSPPMCGMITYEVIEFRTLISVAVAYSIYRLTAEIAMRIQLKTLSPGLALI